MTAPEIPQETPPTPQPAAGVKMTTMQAREAEAKKAMQGIKPPERGRGDAEVVMEMMNRVLSKDDIDQKSRQIFENILGIVQSKVIRQAFIDGDIFYDIDSRFIKTTDIRTMEPFKNWPEFKERDTIEGTLHQLRQLCEGMTVGLVSLDGLGRKEIIQMFQALSVQLQQHQHEKDLVGAGALGNAIMGKR
jgi:hypothetical protein